MDYHERNAYLALADVLGVELYKMGEQSYLGSGKFTAKGCPFSYVLRTRNVFFEKDRTFCLAAMAGNLELFVSTADNEYRPTTNLQALVALLDSNKTAVLDAGKLTNKAALLSYVQTTGVAFFCFDEPTQAYRAIGLSQLLEYLDAGDLDLGTLGESQARAGGGERPE